jgi:hypothetical protein
VVAFAVPAEAERFARLTEPLGVLEVKRDADHDAIIIFVHSEVTHEELDGVRVLAAIEWPKSRIVIARRRPMSDSGPRPIAHITESGTHPATRWSEDRASDIPDTG